MKAIINCPDTGPVESLVVMLRSIGVDCYACSDNLLGKLRGLGHDTIISPSTLHDKWGYDKPFTVPVAGAPDMHRTDVVFIDIKAHRFYEQIVKQWPNLQNRVLWYRINGGMPEHVINDRGDHGDEVNPPCPVLTPNQWYAVQGEGEYQGQDDYGHFWINWPTAWREGIRTGRFYPCWPPFHRFDEYHTKHGRIDGNYNPPICLIHRVDGWGYRDLVPAMRDLGVKCYGVGSPDGLVRHSEIPRMLSKSLAMVHLKSSDAPGYAIYESLAAGCPVICTRRLIWRCRMQDLLIPDETCLVFDRETHDGLTPEDIESCTIEVQSHLERLRDTQENRRIGMTGHNRLKEVMWSEDNPQDVDSLRQFWTRHFGE